MTIQELKTKKSTQTFVQALHPMVESAAKLLCPRFAKYCIAQDMLSSRYPERIKWVVKHLPVDMTTEKAKLIDQWTSENDEANSTSKRWNTLKTFLQEERRKNVFADIALSTLYPRLDANVSTGSYNPIFLITNPCYNSIFVFHSNRLLYFIQDVSHNDSNKDSIKKNR